MPNGDEVSMCAHAAIGAAWLLGRNTKVSPSSQMLLETTDGVIHALATEDSARIVLRVDLIESSELTDAQRTECAEACGLDVSDFCENLPCLKASIARPKTLLPIRSVDRLHAASRWDVQVDGNSKWLQLCDRLGSTGLYLYHIQTKEGKEREIEARQFPRSSGCAMNLFSLVLKQG